MLMPVTEARRNEYSKRYVFRLANDEAQELDKQLKAENMTLPQFIREAMNKRGVKSDTNVTKGVGTNPE